MKLSLRNLGLCITTKRIIKTTFQNANKADQELVGSTTIAMMKNSEKRNDEELSENQEMIEQIFSMMENFTKLIMKIEDKIQRTLITEMETENRK